jgi:glycine/D-amino acid oxidase-like deaminating enzyme
MTESADVVIVGGGAVGCSAAYHLATAGAGDVLLLERAAAVGTGSTGACAGGFRFQFSSRINVELSLESVPMIVGFTERHGLPLDVVRDGYLFLIRDRDVRERFAAALAMQRGLGVEAQLLTPEEAADLVPGISLDGVVAATYCADDGIADPGGLTQGYARLASRAGARLRMDTEVTAIAVEGGRVTGVRTPAGEVATRAVVNAAGPWAGALASSAGVELPLEPVPRMVVTTGPFPGAPGRRTLVVDATTSFYFHREGQGVLMGMGGVDERPSFSLRVDDRFVAEDLLPVAMRVFPPLESAGIARTWAGLYEMTPDRHPILGPTPVEGLWLANGFSGHGFQHAPIVGLLLAEMIVEGAARTVDVSSLDLARFERGDLVPEAHVV